MIEILFRGKRKDSGEWIKGIPIKTHIGTFISFDEKPHYCRQYGYMEIDRIAMVDEKSVCQYTGLTDKDGLQKIFEGDIVKTPLFKPDTMVIGFIDGAFCLVNSKGEYVADIHYIHHANDNQIEIIGNIFDNLGGSEGK